jgi:hypothetical protein
MTDKEWPPDRQTSPLHSRILRKHRNTGCSQRMERGRNMFHSGVEHWLSRERMVEMRNEVEHNRLEARLVRESRLAKAASLSEEARLAKARLSEKADPRRRGMVSRGTAFVTAMFR